MPRFRNKGVLLIWAVWAVVAIYFFVRGDITNALVACVAATVAGTAGYVSA